MSWPARLDRTFEAIVLDWDGTAVPDRDADAVDVRRRIEALCAAGVHIFVVSGTHVGNVDGQLRARPAGPGQLHLCLNRGSEVFAVDAGGADLRHRRVATPDEDAALDRAGAAVVDQLAEWGLDVRVAAPRLNRRKIDLIPVPAWSDPPKARIGELAAAVTTRLEACGLAGLGEVVSIAIGAAHDAGLDDPRITTDAKHIEIGLTDKSESGRYAAEWLAERGITGELILVIGDELGPIRGVPGSDARLLVPELARTVAVSVGVEPDGLPPDVVPFGGGPAACLQILDAQLVRRRELRVPEIDRDPAWTVELPADPALERAAEAIGTLANGRAGLRAAREEAGRFSLPLFAVSGVYTAPPDPRLLEGPVWTGLPVRDGYPDTRVLDLRTGALARGTAGDRPVRTLRFVSVACPAAMALRAEGPTARLDVDAPRDTVLVASGGPSSGGIVVASRDRQRTTGSRRTVERIAAWVADPSEAPDRAQAVAALDTIAGLGFDRLLAAHREAWVRLWRDAVVSIDGAPEDELAARFAVFHLLAAAAEDGESAVGARGLTGAAYGGHVFWDADVFVLPVLAALRPGAARAMLEYRLRRLAAARAAAAADGFRGARFPWESAGDGYDVTPRRARGRHGELIPIVTGEQEEHIVADVAWSASEYAAWSGDHAFLTGSGAPLVLDTARYWASRIRVDGRGKGHLFGVMGPDEYHPVVDDNTYTNVMARWNLRRAADIAAHAGVAAAESASWRSLAASLVGGWDPARGVHEQFAGYWGLEPLRIVDIARPPVAADVLLGPERIAGSQVIKQADVLMLHHLVPGDLEHGSLAADLDFYAPRTAHGSSLSPAIHAALLARAGRPDDALEPFRLAARLDLDDLTGTTAGGLHLATLGGVWQALAYGFLGIRPSRRHLDVAPCLPKAWAALRLRCRVHGQAISVDADQDGVTIHCTRPLRVRIDGGRAQRCTPPGFRYLHGGGKG